MDKELKRIYVAVKFGNPDKVGYEQFSSAILKLFKQEMLRLIGEDIYSDGFDKKSFNQGYNQAKAELRKKVGE